MTDEALILLYLERDSRAIEATREQYGAYCAAIARKLLSDERDVEECLSDCAMAVWNAIPPTVPRHFKGWLGAIVRHRALAIGAENGRRPPTVEESALELAAELGQAISRFLHTRKGPVRAAFRRRYWYADSVAETAACLGWSVSKTKSVLYRARNDLRNFLEQEGFWNG